MSKILFIVAHPALERSRANRAVVRAIKDLPGLTLHSLYDLYPHFYIDVAREQKLLEEHDALVVQHPFYWYNMPPLMKLWQDEVLKIGWAYGRGGDKLRDKKFLLSVTAGGQQEAYAESGKNRFAMDTLLTPWNQTVHLCHMQWMKPIVFHAANQASQVELAAHGDHVRQCLMQLGGQRE